MRRRDTNRLVTAVSWLCGGGAATVHRVRLTLTVPALAVAALIPMVAGCSDSGSTEASSGGQSSSQAPEQSNHGPSFPQCGGISDETIANLTRVAGVVGTAQNSVGCQWLLRGGIMGPHFSFSWYRGSPIGRERKTEEVSRTSVEDINIDGHSGFIAIGTAPTMGDNLCEIGIQFKDDFIEWSVSFAQKPFPDPCDVAKELTRQSIANAK